MNRQSAGATAAYRDSVVLTSARVNRKERRNRARRRIGHALVLIHRQQLAVRVEARLRVALAVCSRSM
jgi:hypothetical protein